MSHTNEPWSATPETDSPKWGIDSGIWGVAICADAPGNGTAEANARRIVACVNACAGISTESLEQGGTGSLLSLGLEEQKRGDIAEKQRDELLAALEQMTQIARLIIGWSCTPVSADGPLVVAERLIAKVKGQP